MASCWRFILVVLALSHAQGQNVTFQNSDTTNVGNISVSEGENLTVCVEKPNVRVRVTAIVRGLPPNPSFLHAALGGLDYSPEQIELVFEASTEQEIKCGQFLIIQDDLNEVNETFFLTLSMQNSEVHPETVLVSITACREGDILLRTYTPEPQYYAVEYCHRSENWITLCDETWSDEDAEVVCRQAGRLGNEFIGYRYGLSIYNERQSLPVCLGNETRIDECQNIQTNMSECLPALVDCGTDIQSYTSPALNTSELALLILGIYSFIVSVLAGILPAYLIIRIKKAAVKKPKVEENAGFGTTLSGPDVNMENNPLYNMTLEGRKEGDRKVTNVPPVYEPVDEECS